MNKFAIGCLLAVCFFSFTSCNKKEKSKKKNNFMYEELKNGSFPYSVDSDELTPEEQKALEEKEAKSFVWIVNSPSGNVLFVLDLNEKKQLTYSLILKDGNKNNVLIKHSPLGLKRNDGDFSENLKFTKAVKSYAVNESFNLMSGKQLKVETKSTERIFTFENTKGSHIQIIARVFNDGIAFRYCFPEQDNRIYTVTEDLTTFSVPRTAKVWLQPYDKITEYSPGYERYYENGAAVGSPAPGAEGWCFPALFEANNAWMMITEAAVDSSYFGAHLQPNSPNGVYSIRMPEENEAMNIGSHQAKSSLPWMMPWRVIIASAKLSDVVESNMIVALNPPSKIKDESWIKPGRSSWSWWSEAASPRLFNSLKKFIDLASNMGWEYSLVDANWDLMEGGNIAQIVDYASSKNVGILMWYNSGGSNNTVTERPRNIISDRVTRKYEFKKLASWGVKGIKVDFFHSDKQHMMKEYLSILEDAAEAKLMVDFHGCTVPRGWSRTWPNLMSMESVKGAENYIFDNSFPTEIPKNNAIFPFTRNVVGSMDYTPVTFSDNRYAHITSYGHELALSIVFESGIVHFADKAESYCGLPPAPKNFLKNIPVIFEKTILVDGYPGKYCIMARQAKGKWYIAGINGTDKPMKLEINLERLGNGISNFEIITDGETDRAFTNYDISLNEAKKFTIEMLPYGGFVGVSK